MVIAQEYMNEYWFESFDRDKIKVEKIKEKLLDPNLTVTQAFSECGVDSKGKYFQHFKDIAGMTPTEFRNKNTLSR